MNAIILFLGAFSWALSLFAFSDEDFRQIENYIKEAIPSLEIETNTERIREQIETINQQIKDPEKKLEDIIENALKIARKLHKKNYEIAFDNFMKDIDFKSLEKNPEKLGAFHVDAQWDFYLSFHALNFIKYSKMTISRKRYYSAILITKLIDGNLKKTYGFDRLGYPSCNKVFSQLLQSTHTLLKKIKNEGEKSLKNGASWLEEIEDLCEIEVVPDPEQRGETLTIYNSCVNFASPGRRSRSEEEIVGKIEPRLKTPQMRALFEVYGHSNNLFSDLPPIFWFSVFFQSLKYQEAICWEKTQKFCEDISQIHAFLERKKNHNFFQFEDNYTLNHPARDYVDNFFIVLLADEDALFEINAGLYCLSRGCIPFSIFTSDFKTHCGKFKTPPENFEHDEQHAVSNIYKISAINLKNKEEMYEKYKIMCQLSYSIIDKEFISPEKDFAFFLLFFLLREAYNSCSILYDKKYLTKENLYGLIWVIEEINRFFEGTKNNHEFSYDFAEYAAIIVQWFPKLKNSIYPPEATYPSTYDKEPLIKFNLENFYKIMSIMFSWLEQKMAMCLAEQDSMTFLESGTSTDPSLKLLHYAATTQQD